MLPSSELVGHLLTRLREVCVRLGGGPADVGPASRFAEVVDSMGFVEFLALTADDCGVPVEAIEQAAGRRYGMVAELAAALQAAGIHPVASVPSAHVAPSQQAPPAAPRAWLAATTTGLPARTVPASALDALLGRPSGWLEERAGIRGRCTWDGEDVLDVAARTGAACLRAAGLTPDAPGTLLVTSEAPPLLSGLAASLHHRLRLPAGTAALELGGACTGFLAALWTAQRLLADAAVVLVLAVEAPTRWLTIEPGAAGEAAALFGDGATACVLTARPTVGRSVALRDVLLATDGAAGSALQVHHDRTRGVALHFDGVSLTHTAVRVMADAVRQMCARHGLTPADLAAVVAHGGNGRLPKLLARRLGIPEERVWSETAQTANLGSASLPVSWAARAENVSGPVVWTAVGAGLQWGAALLDVPAC